jgi:hypothetical protein
MNCMVMGIQRRCSVETFVERRSAPAMSQGRTGRTSNRVQEMRAKFLKEDFPDAGEYPQPKPLGHHEKVSTITRVMFFVILAL